MPVSWSRRLNAGRDVARLWRSALVIRCQKSHIAFSASGSIWQARAVLSLKWSSPCRLHRCGCAYGTTGRCCRPPPSMWDPPLDITIMTLHIALHIEALLLFAGLALPWPNRGLKQATSECVRDLLTPKKVVPLPENCFYIGEAHHVYTRN